MADIALSHQDFQELSHSIIGLKVSLPWKGIGSAIFLELGSLVPLDASSRQHHSEGEACISVTGDWRVEAATKVIYGSANSRPTIKEEILSLQGSTILSVAVTSGIPELIVHFSNGQCLRSMMMTSGNPEWDIRLPDDRYVQPRDGQLIIGSGASSSGTAEEEAIYELTQRIAARWGTPSINPQKGSCANCISFIPIDGEANLLEYGCCIAETGPFDGKVVERNSGCPLFASHSANEKKTHSIG